MLGGTPMAPFVGGTSGACVVPTARGLQGLGAASLGAVTCRRGSDELFSNIKRPARNDQQLWLCKVKAEDFTCFGVQDAVPGDVVGGDTSLWHLSAVLCPCPLTKITALCSPLCAFCQKVEEMGEIHSNGAKLWPKAVFCLDPMEGAGGSTLPSSWELVPCVPPHQAVLVLSP